MPLHLSRIGSEEDSLRNVLSLMPRAPCTNYYKYLKDGLVTLRFDARMALLPGQKELINTFDAARRCALMARLGGLWMMQPCRRALVTSGSA